MFVLLCWIDYFRLSHRRIGLLMNGAKDFATFWVIYILKRYVTFIELQINSWVKDSVLRIWLYIQWLFNLGSYIWISSWWLPCSKVRWVYPSMSSSSIINIMQQFYRFISFQIFRSGSHVSNELTTDKGITALK